MNNLDDKINMLYDFIYKHKTTDDKLEEYDIDIKDINMDDIKVSFNGDTEMINDIKTEILTGKFKKLDYIDDLNTLILKKYSDGKSKSICLYITPYVSEDDINSLDDMNNNDSLFSYILSKLVLSHKTKHIALPIINVDIEYAQLSDILKPYDDMTGGHNYIEMMENEEISNMFSIRCKESFFKTITLKEYLFSEQLNIKNLLFQVIHTLAVLQKEYSGFRHNMLSPANIFVYLKKDTNITDKYTYKKDYYLSNNDFDIKITNFCASRIPGLYSSSMVVPFQDEENNYFDLHYFLNNLLELKNDFDGETTKFLEKIIPHKFRTDKNSFYLTKNEELFTPEDLLEDVYFKEFTKMEHKYTEPTDSVYLTNKIYSKNLKKKKSKNNSHSGSRTLKGGGQNISSIPGSTVRNNPFMTNEQRRIIKNNKTDDGFYKPDNTPIKQESRPLSRPPPTVPKEVPKTDKTKDLLVMRQEIYKNPDFARPPPKQPPPWDHEYIPRKGDSFEIPKIKIHYPEDKKNTRDTDSETDIEKLSMDKYIDKMFPSDNRPRQPMGDTRTPRKEFEPRKEYQPKFNRENRDSNRDYSRDSRPLREDSNYRPPREDNYRPPRDNSDGYYRQTRQPNITEQQVLAEQKMYNVPPMMPPGTMHTHPKYGGPSWIDINNQMTYPPQFVPDLPNYFPYNRYPLLKPNEIPLQKIYNISLGNPAVHTSALNTLYQDALPGDPYVYTMINLFERRQLLNHLRGIMIDKTDGEDMTLQVGKKSFLEYLKLVDFNPYKIGKNPYANLPLDFLLYSAAYPVRFNMENGNIEIAKQSMGVNIRIYNMSEAALKFTNMVPDVTKDMFDVWRDIKFYTWVKENLLDTKICPNFITYILYKLDRYSNINYDNLKAIAVTHRGNPHIAQTAQLKQLIDDFIKNHTTLKSLIGPNGLSNTSGVSLIAITEAPTSNFIEWCSPSYDTAPASRIMKATGCHPPDVWRSVLFQILYTMAVLQEKQIYIRDFCAENNIFIKDIFSDPNNVGHYVYNVNNVNFYVPNFGYLVLIDNRFTDLTVGNTYKIEAPTIFVDHNGYDISNINTLILDSFRKFFDNLQQNNFRNYGFTDLDIDVKNMVTSIKDELDKKDIIIKKIILECFPEYIHNRVGTPLTKPERDSLSLVTMPKLVEGSLIVYQERYDEYRWAIYNGDNGKKKCIILKNNNGKIEIRDVFSYSLKEYPDANNLYQTSEKTFRLNKDSLIETYRL